MENPQKKRAGRNRTLTLSTNERDHLSQQLLRPAAALSEQDAENRIIHGDFTKIAALLPDAFVDLLILDPPYSLAKSFNGRRFSSLGHEEYLSYLDSWFPLLPRLLKPDASIYLCGDWRCSAAGFLEMSKYFKIRGRIVWQREKGRGAKNNWKNCTEDIWFATVSDNYHFDIDAVKLRRRVRAPYRENGAPKDWEDTGSGKFRLTCPSNFWDDISIPFWSMPENTDHPTQKPEKLLAKLILASSPPDGMVFDPFLGSGSSAVAAKKLGRRWCGVEMDEEFCRWGAKRLLLAENNPGIQGYDDGVFWERNSRVGCRPAARERKKDDAE